MGTQIHWHEGLFLQPHHLQWSQKSFADALVGERDLSCPYPCGLIEAKEKSDDMQKMFLRFEWLRAIMPGGVEVNYPATADLSELNIRSALAAGAGTVTVYLAVPLWQEERPNSTEPEVTGSREKVLYTVYNREYADENTGVNPRSIAFRRINAYLTTDADDSGMEVMPLLRIIRDGSTDTGSLRVEYNGPQFLLNGGLRDLAQDLATQVDISRQALVSQIKQAGRQLDIMRRPEMEQMLRLRTLNRFTARLSALARAPRVSPFVIYLELRELLGELSALQPELELFDADVHRAYRHDDPLPAFRELNKAIRALLGTSAGPRYLKVDFEKRDGRYRAEFEDRHFIQPTDYYLGIETAQDGFSLMRLVRNQDEFKLVPRSMEDTPIRGIQVEDVRAGGLPLVFPAKQGLHYFHLALLRSDSRAWDDIRRERAASIRWLDEKSSDYRISLYMPLPAETRDMR